MSDTLILGMAVACLFGIGCALVLAHFARFIRQPLFCGECGQFIDDLTDDDVCFDCSRKLAVRTILEESTK